MNLEDSLKSKVTIREGFKKDGKIIPSKSDNEWLLKEGIYNFNLDGGNEFCSISKVFTIDKNEDEKSLEIPLLKMGNRLAEGKDEIFLYSDQLERLLYSENIEGIEKYEFTSPAFRNDKNLNQFTSSIEREEFLKSVVEKCDYAFFINESFPIIIFSKERISWKGNIFHAVKKSKKINILYHAQIHGNEYASGEAALNIIKEITKKENEYLIDNANIVILPCINQEGADYGTRDYRGVNLNRDFLNCSTSIMENLHSLFFRIMPDVVIDAHTFTRRNSIKNDNIVKGLFDVRVSTAHTNNILKNTVLECERIIDDVFAQLKEQGFRVGYYNNSTNNNIGRIYYSLLGCYSFLFESEGTQSGKFHFKRNVFSQICGILFFIDNIVNEGRKIKKAVKKNRTNQIKKFTVLHRSSGKEVAVSSLDNYDFYGNIINKDEKIYFNIKDISEVVVDIPKSIIIIKNTDNAFLIDQLKKNSVEIIEKKDNYVINLNQYTKYVIMAVMTQWKEMGGIDELFR